MTPLSRNLIALLAGTMTGAALVPVALAQSVPAGTIQGAPKTDDVIIKSKPGTELFRAKVLEPGLVKAQSTTDRVKLAVQMAQALLTAGKFAESVATLAELEGIADKSAGDRYLIERTRVAVASSSGDQVLLVRSLEAVMATDQAPPEERQEFAELLARHYFNQRDFSNAITWSTRYFREGGSSPAMRRALVLSYYLNNDFTLAAQEVGADIQADEQAGRKPSEEQLRVLVSSAQKLNDPVAHANALKKYATHYPRATKAK